PPARPPAGSGPAGWTRPRRRRARRTRRPARPPAGRPLVERRVGPPEQQPPGVGRRAPVTGDDQHRRLLIDLTAPPRPGPAGRCAGTPPGGRARPAGTAASTTTARRRRPPPAPRRTRRAPAPAAGRRSRRPR